MSPDWLEDSEGDDDESFPPHFNDTFESEPEEAPASLD
jgi:hypothetical protein